MTQRRWFCRTCLREWLGHSAAGADPWYPEQGCPGCHGSQIEQVEYRPRFPGGDIPRDAAGMAHRSLPPYGLPEFVPSRDVMPLTASLEPNSALALTTVGAEASSDSDVDDSWTRL